MSISDTGSAQRQTVFSSHANPEDNLVAARVTATLQSAGYLVWCDLQDATPDDDIWAAIAHVLSNEAVKCVSLISTESVCKDGVKKEFELSHRLRRTMNDPGFIIPVRVDDVDFWNMPHGLGRHWVADAFELGLDPALEELCKALGKSGVPKAGSPSAQIPSVRPPP